ncbi:MAG: carboxypeptidase-like regulatory domain-containing protein [Bryobacterales bacterium]|nr:carboxypeptidase-like regulatory domain-containing protein [Bryobacterales bacterium]
MAPKPLSPARLRAIRFTCLTVAILCLGGSLEVHAQTSSAAITGTIRDETGAVIPAADLELTNIETGITLRSASNSVGNYNFLNILPGSYTLGATKDGFRTAAVEPFTLQVNQTATFDIVLEVGAVTETFTVEALGAQIQSQTSEIGNVVAERQVVDLPLNGRNFTQLLSLSAGVAAVNVSQSRGGFTTAAVGEFTYPSINGQTNRSNFFTLDGIYNTGVILNTPQIEPIIDTILEFKVQSHNDHAEFGQGTGGIVNVVTKSGTNELHGSAWWYLRNDNLDARNFFQPNVTPFTQNQFGVAGGGPIVKNKVFFFGSYQGFRYRRSGESFLKVPTAANLTGDLSDVGSEIFDPWSTTVDPNNPETFLRQPFANQQIPQAMIDQGMVAYAQTLLPRPSVVGPGGTNAPNTDPTKRDQEEFSLRGDYNMSETDTFWFRWSEARLNSDAAAGLPSLARLAEVYSKNIGASWVHTFGPTSVLQLQFGRIFGTSPSSTRYREEFVSDNSAFASQVGFADRFCCNYRALGLGTVFVPGLNADGWWGGNEAASSNDLTQVC